jgi:hypothetical protein
MKTIHANGTTYKFGRNRPVAIGPHFKLKNYMLASLPDPPRHVNYSSAASVSLGNIFGNDVEGDCGPAAVAHIEGVWTGNAGGPVFIPSMTEVNAFYSGVEGPPGYPKIDQGVDEITMLNYWQNTGFAGRKIQAWMAVDATDMHECKTALWLFENLIYAVFLPDAYVNPFPGGSGFTWNVAGPPDQQNGHIFPAFGYDFRFDGKRGFEIGTWAMTGRITPSATSTYAVPAAGGGLYTALSWDAINKAQAKAPNRFSFLKLQADFAAMG